MKQDASYIPITAPALKTQHPSRTHSPWKLEQPWKDTEETNDNVTKSLLRVAEAAISRQRQTTTSNN